MILMACSDAQRRCGGGFVIANAIGLSTVGDTGPPAQKITERRHAGTKLEIL